MIAEHEKEIILQCAKKYNVSYILLFGSSIKGKSFLLAKITESRGISRPSVFVTI